MKFSGMVVDSVNLTLKRERPRTLELEVVAIFNGEKVTMAFDVYAADIDHLAQICALARGL